MYIPDMMRIVRNKSNIIFIRNYNCKILSITCENGKLVITPDAERAAIAEAEADFMEREIESLKKKFEVEKAKLHAQFVAEQGAGYATVDVTD